MTIVDADGKPVADAKVEFKVYNYAEFYTVASKQTDADGKTFLTAGKRGYAGMGFQRWKISVTPNCLSEKTMP